MSATLEKKDPTGTEVATVDNSPANEGDESVQMQTPDFAPLTADAQIKSGPDMARFHDVQVLVSAELGRTKIPIQKLLQLGSGAVIELNRPIASPVELVAQGVPLACGEVVVVNDCFAIRIKEIYSGQMNAMERGG